MHPSDLLRLFLLAALWGASFIFIRIIAPALGPVVAATGRVVVAGLTLAVIAAVTRQSLGLREHWRRYLAIGILNSAIPFALINWAELHITAATAAIINATSPLFGAVIAAIWLRDRLSPRTLIGIAFGIGGVVVLVGWSPIEMNGAVIAAICASLAAAFFYGLAGTYMRANPSTAPLIGTAAGSQLAAAVAFTPALPFTPVPPEPTPVVLGALLALGIFSTAFAYLLYFRLITTAGVTRALSVTFLVPLFGLLWGALFLHEPITPSAVAGCVVVLVGTAFVTIKGRERTQPPPPRGTA